MQVRWTINSTNVGKDIQLRPFLDVVGINGSDKSIKFVQNQLQPKEHKVKSCEHVQNNANIT